MVWLLVPCGWSGGAMILGNLPVPGRPTIWMIVGQGPTALAVGAGGGCLDIFTLIYPFSPLSPSLWEMARYILKYCLKGPLNPKQPTNYLFHKNPVLLLIRVWHHTGYPETTDAIENNKRYCNQTFCFYLLFNSCILTLLMSQTSNFPGQVNLL